MGPWVIRWGSWGDPRLFWVIRACGGVLSLGFWGDPSETTFPFYNIKRRECGFFGLHGTGHARLGLQTHGLLKFYNALALVLASASVYNALPLVVAPASVGRSVGPSVCL